MSTRPVRHAAQGDRCKRPGCGRAASSHAGWVPARTVACERCGQVTADLSHGQRKRFCSYDCSHAQRDALRTLRRRQKRKAARV